MNIAARIAALVGTAMLVLSAPGYGQTPGGAPAAAPPSAFTPAAPFIIGTVLIQGVPANKGTVVAVSGAVGSNEYQACGTGAVGAPPPGAPPSYSPQPGGFTVTVDASRAACASPTTRYNFYVNGIWAGSQSNTGITAGGGFMRDVTLNAPIAAATTGVPSAIPGLVVYLYGQIENLNRTPADGVTVTAVAAQNRQCAGQGKSFDLKYVPAAAPSRAISKPGFFVVPVAAAGQPPASCGRLLDLYVNGVKLPGSRNFAPNGPAASAIDVGVLQMPY